MMNEKILAVFDNIERGLKGWGIPDTKIMKGSPGGYEVGKGYWINPNDLKFSWWRLPREDDRARWAHEVAKAELRKKIDKP
jgi:hypothetical protein